MRIPARNHSDGGFTLTELLIVIVILGVLVAIAIPQFMGQRQKATGAAARSDLRNAATIEESQLADSGAYVSSLSALTAAGFKRSSGVQLGFAANGSNGYCEVASANGTYWWFDSTAGGVQSATTTALTPPVSANGVCKSSAPAAVS
jgi:type IV pilus assembly protein PilA